MAEEVRCFLAGMAAKGVQCYIDTALASKDHYVLKSALYNLSQAGKELATEVPDSKDIANKVRHRGHMLLRIASDLGDKSKAHEEFFFDQLVSLKKYAQDLENQAKTSCLGYQYQSPTLKPLPSVPKDVYKAAKKEKTKRIKDVLKRHKQYLKKAEKSRLKK